MVDISEPMRKQARRKKAPDSREPEADFLAILNNRAKTDKSASRFPARRQGFVVLVRGTSSLKTLQSLCFDSERQPWNICLTLRYRLRPKDLIGTLFAGVLADLKKIMAGETDRLHADVYPVPSKTETTWQRLLSGPLVQFVASLPDAQQGAWEPNRLNEFFKLLSLEEVLSTGMRLVVFAEIAEDGLDAKTGFDLRSDEWRHLGRLPERCGIVFCGAPKEFHLPTAEGHFFDLQMTDEADAGEAEERVTRFKQPGFHSDRAATEDRLGVNDFAEALARFLLHPQTTPPLTIGIHGPWGKGKSSFMELIDIALVKYAAVNRAARTQKYLDLHNAIASKQTELENAPEENQSALRNEIAGNATAAQQLWQEMKTAAESEILTVRFNAWQYEDSRQIWAGLASVISNRLEKALSGWEHVKMRFVYAWRHRRLEVWLNLLLPLIIAALIGLVFLFFGETTQNILAGTNTEAKDLPASLILLKILIPAGSALFLLGFLLWRILKVVQPVSERVLGYMQLPSYRDQMGYQHKVMDDLRFVHQRLTSVHPSCKVAVYIDDLDRCSEEKIMEILQAINLILGGGDFFVFLGMDTEMVYRAIRVYYRKSQTDETLPENFSENYLRKIIQVSFHLPKMPAEYRFSYVGSLFTAAARKAFLAAQETRQPVPEANAPARTEPAGGLLPFDLTQLHKPVRQMLEEVEDTAEELAVYRELQDFLVDNPREIKRIVNVHRLVKILLQRKDAAWSAARQKKLATWLIFCANWPDLVDDLLAIVKEHDGVPNCLAELAKTLDGEADGLKTNGGKYSRLQKFAAVAEPLAADDIDDDFQTAAYVTHLITESPAIPKNVPDVFGFQNAVIE